jgi:hypothetical protein
VSPSKQRANKIRLRKQIRSESTQKLVNEVAGQTW